MRVRKIIIFIMEEKSGYLAALGITAPLENLGCFDGTNWMGSGEE